MKTYSIVKELRQSKNVESCLHLIIFDIHLYMKEKPRKGKFLVSVFFLFYN